MTVVSLCSGLNFAIHTEETCIICAYLFHHQLLYGKWESFIFQTVPNYWDSVTFADVITLGPEYISTSLSMFNRFLYLSWTFQLNVSSLWAGSLLLVLVFLWWLLHCFFQWDLLPLTLPDCLHSFCNCLHDSSSNCWCIFHFLIGTYLGPPCWDCLM